MTPRLIAFDIFEQMLKNINFHFCYPQALCLCLPFPLASFDENTTYCHKICFPMTKKKFFCSDLSAFDGSLYIGQNSYYVYRSHRSWGAGLCICICPAVLLFAKCSLYKSYWPCPSRNYGYVFYCNI